MITPKILKGFRDYLPDAMIPKKKIISALENIFESFGFVPIDTPALEYTEILLGKGGGDTDKQVYRFKDHGDRDIALRFDLTVPLARFIALNFDKLTFPFKRYHISPVWRGENTQKGRFREFYQCDFDILGDSSPSSDLEILLLIYKGLKAINAGDFIINVNHRVILNSYLEKTGLKEKSGAVLRAIDKLYKIGIENVKKELLEQAGITESVILEIFNFLNLNDEKNLEIKNDDIFLALSGFKTKLGADFSSKVDEFEKVFKALKKLGILKYFALNPAITRGLDYYTGIIFESFITDRREFGSICSGGRYDNLINLYSKNVVSGVGACFGLDRIMALLEDKNLLDKKSTKTQVLIFNLDEACIAGYFELAEKLRALNINTEVFFEQKKIAQQFKFAEKKGIPFVIIAGADELKTGKYNLKDIIKGEEQKGLAVEEISKIVG